MKTTSLIFALIVAISCGSTKNLPVESLLLLDQAPEKEQLIYETHPGVHKLSSLPINGESTPVIWNNKILIVTSGLYFTDLETRQQIAPHHPVSFALISAIVYNNRLYVFGTDGNATTTMSYGNAVWMTSSSDLLTWTTPAIVLQMPSNMASFNTSVAQDASGFVMAIEFHTQDQPTDLGNDVWETFHTAFAHSTDLTNWNFVGGVLNPTIYSACPTIRYMQDGYYYVINNQHHARTQEAFVSRSKDLVTWEMQKVIYVVVSPKNAPAFEFNSDKGPSNDSDVDLVEFNGQVHIVYDFGDQATYGGEGYATYNGTMQNFFKMFF